MRPLSKISCPFGEIGVGLGQEIDESLKKGGKMIIAKGEKEEDFLAEFVVE